jgi:hypothetical protein
MTSCHRRFTKRKKDSKENEKGEEKKSDPIHGQYTNACKLAANLRWPKLFLKNHIN